MTQQIDQDTVDTDPAQAFEELRGEIIRLSRLVDHLGTVPDRTPDYSPTLAEMARSLKAFHEGLVRIEESPAVSLTPDAMTDKLVELSQIIRSADREMLIQAHKSIMQSVARIDGMIERGQAADRQWRRLLWSAAGAALLMLALPGTIARSLPESWYVPEKMAARVMRLDMAHAGERLLSIARGEVHHPTANSDATAKVEKIPTPSRTTPRR